MGYDFSRFSPQSFERFAQALATKKLGAGISVFGAGPDGAREVSFQGPLPITTHGAAWDGYVVAQSKYKSVLKGGVEDIAWLQKELVADLDKFLDPKRNLRKPEYYIVITNVNLSSVVSGRSRGKGGQQKIEELFESYKVKIGLLGWLVWHADLLSAMLDSERDIRTRYSAWVTEGDVLASALAALKRPSITSVVPLALRRDLRKDRDIRRKDAGQITDKRIYLEDVFVDLPLEQLSSASRSSAAHMIDGEDKSAAEMEEENDLESASDEDDRSEHPAGIVARLLERCADKLDPQSLGRRKRNRRPHPSPNRIVLLGGPGQGKSTVAQFLAQVSRARVTIDSLRNEPPDLALEAAETILSRAQQEGIGLHGPARFPVHVELPKFADAIKQASDLGSKLSLLRHCSNLLGRESDQKLDPTDLRTWLGEYPWLLILDGLDEVPATGNRSDVVVAVNEFLDDVNHVGGDVLVVITTRPQGYGDDFPRRHWEHWTMGNLSSGDAMRFARRLADVLLSDGSRRDEILAELMRASEDPATAPIMISPLQVSILFSLVETRGGVPADRWSLFQRHYILLRDREAAKEGDTAKLLRDYTSQIDQIHYDAGFLLHVRAEASGTADAFLSEKELELLIDHQLASEGHRDESIRSVKHRLVKIATDRLVLLGSKTGGQIAFDVRSLQEFMAAARIMSSPESAIAERLSEISARTHWRHVFRIAASKAFALTDLTHLRRQIVHICDALDKGDLGSSDRVAVSGARLAIDLLVDNVAARLPDIRRSLVTRSMELLLLGPEAIKLPFLQFLDDDTKQTFEATIIEHLGYTTSRRSDAAFALLFQISNRSPRFASWAEGLILKAWPAKPSEVLRLIDSVSEAPNLPMLRTKIFEAQVASDPKASIQLIMKSIGAEPLEETEMGQLTPCTRWLCYFFGGYRRGEVVNVIGQDGKQIFQMFFWPLLAMPKITIPDWLRTSPKWRVFLKLAEFTASPNKAGLAAVCREIACDIEQLESLNQLSLLWPLDLLLGDVVDEGDLISVADRVEQGLMGDFDEWLDAEKRWAKEGIHYSAVKAWVELPRDEVRFVNSLDIRAARRVDDQFVEGAALAYLEMIASSNSTKKTNWLLRQLSTFARRSTTDNTKNRIIELLTSNAAETLTDRQFFMVSRAIDRWASLQPASLERLARIGRVLGSELLTDGGSRNLLRAFEQNRELRGLLPLFVPMNRAVLTKQAAERLEAIPVDALRSVDSDTPAIRAAISMIKLVRGLTPVEETAQTLNCIANTLRPHRLSQFSRLIRHSPWLANERAIAILTTLCESFDANEHVYDSVGVLKSELDSRPSKFDDPAASNKLSLPSFSTLQER
jgi:hypothetical protein